MDSAKQGGDQGKFWGGDSSRQSGVWGQNEDELRGQLLTQNQRPPPPPPPPVVSRPAERGGRDPRDQEQGGRIKCFKCGREGHHQATCANPPLCYSCHSSGHIASNCPMSLSKRGVKLCGFGIPGQGFYSLHVDATETSGTRTLVRGILIVIQGVATVPKIINELKNLFLGLQWDWKVKQLSDKEFLISFPSEDVRSKISSCKSFDFDTSSIKASVVETGMTEEAIDELAIVWVKIYGIPKLARAEESTKAIVE